MSVGRTVRLFLVGGHPKGIVTAEIMNWTGHVVAAPRSLLAEVVKREEANRTGVYLLFGEVDEETGRRSVYIGESDNIGSRLLQHMKSTDKDFFENICIITSKDQNITKAHARYLEGRLVAIAKEAGRSDLHNGTEPSFGRLPESDVSDMEYFIEQIKVVLPVLGYDVFSVPVVRHVLQVETNTPARDPQAAGGDAPLPSSPVQEDSLDLEIVINKYNILARAILYDGRFIVLEGSQARGGESEFFYSYKNLREQLIKAGDIVVGSDKTTAVFVRNVEFSSPSAASTVILGRISNGRTEWILKKNGMALGQYQQRQLQGAL